MKRHPRVLVISEIYLPQIGGSITWLHNSYIRHPDKTVFLLTKKYRGTRDLDQSIESDSTRSGIRRVVRRSFERYWFLRPHSLLMYLNMLVSAMWIVLRHKIDIIHVGKNLPEGYIARIVSKTLRVPYVIYAHGEEITICQGDPKLAPTIRPVYDDAAAVIANSTFTVETLAKAGVRTEHVTQISPGVDADTFCPAAPDDELVSRLGLEGKVVLLSVGRLTLRKGHDQVISALPRILEAVPNLVYVIASDGEEREHLEELVAKHGVGGAVHFLGAVDVDSLPRLYNTCDIFIMANRELPGGDIEGFGIVFLEANACGKPVIGGASGGTSDAIRHGQSGLRIDGTSIDEIVDAVTTLAADAEKRQAMGTFGRKLVLENYTWDVICARTQAVTRRVIGAEVAVDGGEDSNTKTPERLSV